jgi:amino acid permease
MNEHNIGVVQFWAENPQQFMWQVFAPIGIWLLIVLAFFIMLLKKYTFGNWTAENKNPYDGETFNMPRGVFRGIITLSLLFVVVIFELVTVRIVGFEDQFHELMVAFQMMVAFYFGSKVMHHMTSTDRQKTETIAQNASSLMQSPQTDEFGDDSAAG